MSMFRVFTVLAWSNHLQAVAADRLGLGPFLLL
jgi:hypothetical protein